MLRHPGVNKRVAEVIRKSICKHSWKAMEGSLRQVRKSERGGTICERHGECGQLDSCSAPSRIIGKGLAAEIRIGGYGANPSPP